MPPLRTFAALIDQDSVAVLEYVQEKAGFRVINTRSVTRRSVNPDDAADVVVQLLQDLHAKNVSLSVVLQHFGSFFHTIVLPPAPDEIIRPIILREIQRSFNITDPAIAYAIGGSTERREAPRDGGTVAPRQVLIAGAPKDVVAALQTRFAKARIQVEGVTVIPEVFRRLYDALDGSTEATALLVCLSNGPHVAFFVNGKLELAIEPPLSLEGEAPLDSALIVDQLERGAIFLRQQARGTVATRLLLTAASDEYDTLASTIEGRTGMRVAPLGRGIGSPEMVIAMGAVLAARGDNRLDLFPRAPTFDVRVRRALAGPSLAATCLLSVAAIAAVWAVFQFTALSRERRTLVGLQQQVADAIPAVAALRSSAQGRERIAGIRAALDFSRGERRVVSDLLTNIAAAGSPGTQLDSFSMRRVADGWKTVVFGRASGANGALAVGAATSLYHSLQQRSPKLKDLDFQVGSYLPHPAADSTSPHAIPDQLLFTVTFVAPSKAAK